MEIVSLQKVVILKKKRKNNTALAPLYTFVSTQKLILVHIECSVFIGLPISQSLSNRDPFLSDIVTITQHSKIADGSDCAYHVCTYIIPHMVNKNLLSDDV
jgi:hypothetical protein